MFKLPDTQNPISLWTIIGSILKPNGSEDVQLPGDLTVDGTVYCKKYGVFASLDAPAATPILVPLTYYPIQGNFTNNPIEAFSLTTYNGTGAIQYDGEIAQWFHILWAAEMESNLNNNEIYGAIAVNGVVLSGSEIGTFAKNANEGYSFAGVVAVELHPGDKIQLMATGTIISVITYERFTTSINRFFS